MAVNSKVKRLVLLDAHAILHRAYHALPDFSTSKGEPSGALYGVSTMMIGIIEDLRPDYIAACFDLPKPTHRHEAYKDYKAGRAKTDDALVSQIIRSRDVFAAFNIPIYEKEGFEADDMLGTIVERLKKDKNTDIIIASGDMDTLQLVSDKKVQVYTLKKGIKDVILYDEEAVKERFGFGPELLPDYKGLRGDPSDNIPGIKGIGEKTATILIKEFGTVEAMYKALEKKGYKVSIEGITPRILELLKNGKEEAEFSKILATIRRDAPIEFSLPEVAWKDGLDMGKIMSLFSALEFRTLGARLKDVMEIRNQKSEIKAKKSNLQSPISNIETSSFELVSPGSSNIDPLLLKETAVALWLTNSNITNPKLEDILNFSESRNFSEAREAILGEIEKKSLKRVFLEIEKPLVPVLQKMEKEGIEIDREYLLKLSKEYHATLSSIEKNVWKMAGKEFNIASPKQLGDVLFKDLGLKAPRQKKTAGGALSTRESELEKLREAHPIIDEVLRYREFAKLLGTYIDAIPPLLDEKSRLHTHFIQAGAMTGRMATEDPGLQNIPNKTDLGRAIRRAFVARKGYVLLALDYSQIELRIAAFLSKDEKLIDIFRSGQDVHAAVAARVFKVPEDKVTKAMRIHAKTINFGILYGMGVTSLKAGLGTSREEAQKFYDDYFSTFDTLATYLDRVKAEAAAKGYTETLYGRRRYLEGIRSKLPFIRAAAERMAINAPIQGTQADIIKRAMVDIDAWLAESKKDGDAYMLLQVHDELVFEVKKGTEKEFALRFKDIMESVVDEKDRMGVPIIAEARAGKNWEEMEKIV